MSLMLSKLEFIEPPVQVELKREPSEGDYSASEQSCARSVPVREGGQALQLSL
jgi:hypothetical protein